jgi:hypothetical protein
MRITLIQLWDNALAEKDPIREGEVFHPGDITNTGPRKRNRP